MFQILTLNILTLLRFLFVIYVTPRVYSVRTGEQMRLKMGSQGRECAVVLHCDALHACIEQTGVEI